MGNDFEELAEQHKDAVYRLMVKVCGNREDAEDVLIDALLKAYQALDQLRDTAAFRSWLIQIAKRLCFQLKRREALAPILQMSALEDRGMSLVAQDLPIDERVQNTLMADLLDAALSTLSPEYREVYELRDVQQLSGEEVSQLLKISLAAQKSRLHRARAGVRAYVDRALGLDGAFPSKESVTAGTSALNPC